MDSLKKISVHGFRNGRIFCLYITQDRLFILYILTKKKGKMNPTVFQVSVLTPF